MSKMFRFEDRPPGGSVSMTPLDEYECMWCDDSSGAEGSDCDNCGSHIDWTSDLFKNIRARAGAHFGDVIRAARLKQGLRLKDVCAVTGINLVYLSEVERRVSAPFLFEHIDALSTVLKLDKELLTYLAAHERYTESWRDA